MSRGKVLLLVAVGGREFIDRGGYIYIRTLSWLSEP